MLLEEKLYVLEQIKKGGSIYASSSRYDTFEERELREKFSKSSTDLLFFSLRFLLALLLFVLCYLMVEQDVSFFQLTTNDLQYYLTTHYFLP